MPRPLWLFCLVNLVIGSGAFVITGVLAPMAAGLGISIAAAGQAMTAYALSAALLAPLLLLATGRWPRRHALMLALALFALGTGLCATAGTLGTLLVGRALMGAGAAFTPIAAGIALTLVEPARRGQALAFVFLGFSLSYVVGVPLGTWIGMAWGWQTPLWLITALVALALAAVALRVPRALAAPGASFAGSARLLARREVMAALGLTLLNFTAIFTVFSYIGPVLQALRPMSALQLSLTLAWFGTAGVAGTLIGGRCNDRFGYRRTLRVQLIVLGTTMALLPLTAGSLWALLAVLMLWAGAGFGMIAPQQSWLAALSPVHTPLLFSLNSSMLSLGTAAGAVVGGALAAGIGVMHLSWAGLPFIATGLALLHLAPTSSAATPPERPA